MKDFLMIILTHDHTPTCYAKRRAKISAKGYVLPGMILVLLMFFFLTSIAVAFLENIPDLEAIWYSFMTLSTVGLQEFTRERILHIGNAVAEVGVTLCLIFWLITGTMMFGAILLHLLEQGDFIHLREVAEIDEKPKQTKPSQSFEIDSSTENSKKFFLFRQKMNMRLLISRNGCVIALSHEITFSCDSY